ncbi:MAG TPA: hypothetical protein VGI39_29465 [Polyangiaceae bacterium]|jgi:hypothetical protein
MMAKRSVFLFNLLAMALGGCAVDASLDTHAKENVGAASAADSVAYLQTFDPDFQSIIFQPASATGIDGVILHVTINGTRTTNVAMPETGTSAAAGPSYEVESLPVLPGDSIVYSFTYTANGLAHDTPQFRYTLPASFVPKTFFTQVEGGAIVVTSTAPLAWADVHYTVNGGTQQNVRLVQDGARYVQPVALQPGDGLAYSVTYSTGVAVFDTAVARYSAGSAGARFVVDLGADSAEGVCVANGDSAGRCNLRAAFLAAGMGPATLDLAVDSTVSAGQIEVGASSTISVESVPGGAVHAITGAATSRLFQVDSGASLAIRNVSISNFRAVDAGGAITNLGSLDLEGVTLASNSTSCSGTGAMTAFANCSAGAISNTGTLTLGGGTVFTNNGATADAWTASYTTAWAGGGAVVSSGTIAIVGPVTFSNNSAVAAANSGYHNAPIGGANASAAGGAIFNSGTLKVTAPAGSCQFLKNAATASGATVNGTATLASEGGAIENTGTLEIPAGACVFSGNSAGDGPDVFSANLLTGPWQFVGSDVSPSTAYSISGDSVDLDFQGYFSWNGTWASGYQGYTFQQPAAVVQGGTYVLTVTVTNANEPIPVVVEASLSGAGAVQEQSSPGNGVLTFTFNVASDPGSAPAVQLIAHPVLGHLGPVEGTGIGVQSYELTGSLTSE